MASVSLDALRRKRALKMQNFNGDSEKEPFLVLESDTLDCELAPKVIPLRKRTITIGRSRDVDFTIFDLMISRFQATLCINESEEWEITDNHSSNGTFVNDEILRPKATIRLRSNDLVRFGPPDGRHLVYRFKQQEAANSPPESKKLKAASDLTDDEYVCVPEEALVLSENEEKAPGSIGANVVAEEVEEEVLLEQHRNALEEIANMSCSLEELGSSKTVELEMERERLEKALSGKEDECKLLESKIEEMKSTNSEAIVMATKMQEDLKKQFTDTVENELQCSICSELFIKATTLNCSHSFCNYCISEWKKKKKICPMCRKPINSETLSVVLDSFIDRIVGDLSTELQETRRMLIEQRQAITSASKSKSKRKQHSTNINLQSTANNAPQTGHLRVVLRQTTGGQQSLLAIGGQRPLLTLNGPAGTRGFQFTHIGNANSNTVAISTASTSGAITVSTVNARASSANTRPRSTVAVTTNSNAAVVVSASRMSASTSHSGANTSGNRSNTSHNRPHNSEATVESTHARTNQSEATVNTTRASSSGHAIVISSDSDLSDSEPSVVRGVSGAYYGGFGRCYRCGSAGHWANGCPY